MKKIMLPTSFSWSPIRKKMIASLQALTFNCQLVSKTYHSIKEHNLFFSLFSHESVDLNKPKVKFYYFWKHKVNSGVTGGGGGGGEQSAPQRLLTGKFLLMYREKEARKKWKTFFSFFFFFFCFSLLQTMEICFGSTKMGIFNREKAFHAGKKIRKNDFAPLEKYACCIKIQMLTRTQVTTSLLKIKYSW